MDFYGDCGFGWFVGIFVKKGYWGEFVIEE
jgi:hypothetical protein